MYSAHEKQGKVSSSSFLRYLFGSTYFRPASIFAIQISTEVVDEGVGDHAVEDQVGGPPLRTEEVGQLLPLPPRC